MKKVLSIILSVAIVVILFSGCASGKNTVSENSSSQNVALVIAQHDNFPAVSLNNQSISSTIYDACLSYGRVTATVCDGLPFLAGDYTINKPNVNVDNTKRKQLAEKNCNQIILECSTAKAKTAEIDTLSAISQAAKSIQNSENSKTLLIFDSGLSTTGLLNFSAQNLIDADISDIVEQLKAKHSIPNVKGCNIIWSGLGQTCGEQSPLTEYYKFRLQEIYNAIITAGGASNVTFNNEPIQGEEPEGVPECSVVPVVEDSLNITSAIPEIIKFDDTKISFVSDKAEFVSEEKAQEALKPISKVLNDNTDTKILVIGSTATDGTKSGCKTLSKMRADKVKETLLKQNVLESQILTYGAGQETTCFRVNDIKNGKLIESEAQKNRAVYIVNANSPIAKEFKV